MPRGQTRQQPTRRDGSAVRTRRGEPDVREAARPYLAIHRDRRAGSSFPGPTERSGCASSKTAPGASFARLPRRRSSTRWLFDDFLGIPAQGQSGAAIPVYPVRGVDAFRGGCGRGRNPRRSWHKGSFGNDESRQQRSRGRRGGSSRILTEAGTPTGRGVCPANLWPMIESGPVIGQQSPTIRFQPENIVAKYLIYWAVVTGTRRSPWAKGLVAYQSRLATCRGQPSSGDANNERGRHIAI
jgi:hypothetical protein